MSTNSCRKKQLRKGWLTKYSSFPFLITRISFPKHVMGTPQTSCSAVETRYEDLPSHAGKPTAETPRNTWWGPLKILVVIIMGHQRTMVCESEVKGHKKKINIFRPSLVSSARTRRTRWFMGKGEEGGGGKVMYDSALPNSPASSHYGILLIQAAYIFCPSSQSHFQVPRQEIRSWGRKIRKVRM